MSPRSGRARQLSLICQRWPSHHYRQFSYALTSLCHSHGLRYIVLSSSEGSHNGSAAVLKTAVRKDMQVRVLSPPPYSSTTYRVPSDHIPSVPVATWRDFGALLGARASRPQ